jgi:hypothetical protein
MDIRHHTGWGIALAAAALALTSACGTELAPAPSDIGQEAPASPTTSEVVVPSTDSTPCSASIREANQQDRPLCAS